MHNAVLRLCHAAQTIEAYRLFERMKEKLNSGNSSKSRTKLADELVDECRDSRAAQDFLLSEIWGKKKKRGASKQATPVIEILGLVLRNYEYRAQTESVKVFSS